MTDPIHEVVLCLGYVKNGEFWGCGSGVMISPSFILTARHVVENCYLKSGVKPEDADFSIIAFQVLHTSQKGNIYQVRKITYNNYIQNDLALLYITPYLAQTPTNFAPVISLKQLSSKDKIDCFGHSRPNMQIKEENICEWFTDGKSSSGLVEDFHINGRGIFKFMGYSTNMRSLDGMSGGGVFHEGCLVGVINGDLDIGDGNSDTRQEGSLFFSSLAPFLLFKLDVTLPELNISNQSLYVYQLIELGYFVKNARYDIGIITDSEGTPKELRF